MSPTCAPLPPVPAPTPPSEPSVPAPAPSLPCPSTDPAAPLLWDIFCHVIDNWGDLGVCWRLARQLALRGQRVRLWADDPSALAWMAPGALQGQGALAKLSVYHWPRQQPEALPPPVEPGDVLIEAFGCTIEPHWVQALQPAGRAGQVWINLEYLSAEPWVERCHGLPSPVLSGPLAGRCKWFYYPGFTPGSGGLLRENPAPAASDAPDTPDAHYASAPPPTASSPGATAATDLRLLLFCYAAPALPALLADPALAQAHWLVAAGRTQATWRSAQCAPRTAPCPAQRATLLPLLAQTEFDALLRTCNLNLVRGEDSLVSALWAGRPLVWQLYPQHDQAHHAKLEAFLDWLEAPPCLRQFHRVWNGLHGGTLPTLSPQRLRWWDECSSAARQRLLQQGDLVRRLLRFVAEKR